MLRRDVGALRGETADRLYRPVAGALPGQAAAKVVWTAHSARPAAMRVTRWTAMRSCQRAVSRRHRTPRLASASMVACPNRPLRRSADAAALRHRAGDPHSHVPCAGRRQPQRPVRLSVGGPGPRAWTASLGRTPTVDAMRRVRGRVTQAAVSRGTEMTEDVDLIPWAGTGVRTRGWKSRSSSSCLSSRTGRGYFSVPYGRRPTAP